MIKKLKLTNFGPFIKYELVFDLADQSLILLTGKNNEGKSSIINALKFVDAATRVIGKRRQFVTVDGELYYKLLVQDTEHINIKKTIHNYSEQIAMIEAIFTNNLKINVYLDPENDMIYADYEGSTSPVMTQIFGFIPPLGPLNENEELMSISHIKSSINSSLAPRHLRNHMVQLLNKDDFQLIKQIVSSTWEGIELLDYEIDYSSNKVYCYYSEQRMEREISWAGQGLQVWFQIITHLVRLRDVSILILDEPEINLHPQKQNELITIMNEYYSGNVFIATHSVELMNHVNVSHIIHVKKSEPSPKIKSTNDRKFLNLVRSEVGSNFNLIASQFEEFDHIIFTEDESDFKIVKELASSINYSKKLFNIPIHGFSQYNKCLPYKEAYEMLIGKSINYTLLLDRDYYPDQYLQNLSDKLDINGIKTVFTPGKEIENLFLINSVISNLFPKELQEEFTCFWNAFFDTHYYDSLGNFLSLHEKFLPSGLDTKTITKDYTPKFHIGWNDPDTRNFLAPGKPALKEVRKFYQKHLKKSLTQKLLIEELIKANDPVVNDFANQILS